MNRSGLPAFARPPAVLAWLCAAATVFCQIRYSVTDPAGRTALTVLTVLSFAAASLADAWSRSGARAAIALVVVAGGGGLLAEVTGLRTGFPFGTYEYTDDLGWSFAGVPGVVPLAWLMMAWPALLAGRALAVKPVGVVAVAACALAAWDVFLDPQMVDAGYWTWSSPEPSLPLVDGIPVTNFAGWLLVAVLIQAALHRLVPGPADPIPRLGDGPAPALYVWTWFSSVWAHFAFFGRPWVALAGGVLMGAVALPFAIRLGRSLRWARVSA